MIGTTEPLSSVPGSSDRDALLLTEGNFEIILNLDKILVHVMCYCVIISLYVLSPSIAINTDFFFLNMKALIFQAEQGTNKISGLEHCSFKENNPKL